MHILIPRNSLLKELFPKIKNPENLSDEDIAAIKNAYSITNVTPEVEVEDDIIKIIFDEELIQKESDKFKKVVQLCEQNNYSKALTLVDELIEQDPAVSDYHRIKGQIFFEQGDAENAVDALIDAVRLDPENINALILLGNLHARAYSDAESALSFYERVLELDPENYLAINNFGGNLANLGKYDEAKRYFELAHELKPDYPNTLYGMALIESRQNNSKEAFDYVRRALIKLDPKKQSVLYNQAFQLIREEAQKSLKGDLGELVSPYQEILEEKSEKGIVVEASASIIYTGKTGGGRSP
ncbi:tetratricopeptide repeat protein [Halalkalibaculum sp. DA3122]|uniref:tetratricopeptide repeat protein n=1 Tax=Halalkalibaculum sp. DA3122 TaxID=3373607 RepID=UPI003753FBA9